jgi:dynein heavy chain
VEDVMKLSLREEMVKAVEAYPTTKKKEWVLQWPGQIVLAASQIHWTSEVTQVLFSKNNTFGIFILYSKC